MPGNNPGALSKDVRVEVATANPLAGLKRFEIRSGGKPTWAYTGPGAPYETTSTLYGLQLSQMGQCDPNMATQTTWNGTAFTLTGDPPCATASGDSSTSKTTVTGTTNANFTAIVKVELNQVVTYRSRDRASDHRLTVSVCLTNLPPYDTVLNKQYYAAIGGTDAPKYFCGLSGKYEFLTGDTVTKTLVYKQTNWRPTDVLTVRFF